MIRLKTEEEIGLIRESSLLVSKTLSQVAAAIRPGVTPLELDKIAEEFIRDHKAVPAFLNYHGFPNSLCISMNEQVVHGIPTNNLLKEGDVVSVDCGAILDGYFGDSAYTFTVGEVSAEVMNLLRVTKQALYLGIEQAVAGNRVGDIGFAIQQHCEVQHNYGVVRELVGHGLGRNLHEDPEVPNYGKRGRGTKMKENTVIAIEPMVNMGRKEVLTLPDGWTIATRDGKVSAHFEHTIVVRKNEAEILTTFDYIEEEIKKNSEIGELA
jgi:methionyl aminopeptidase